MVGEIYEAAVWVEGPDRIAKADEVLAASLEEAEVVDGVTLGPPVYVTLEYGDERVPEPPKPGLKLRYVTAQVIADNESPLFDVSTLSFDDLKVLREITRRKYKEMRPMEPTLTDQQADAMIARVAPKTIEAMLEKRVLN